MGETWEDRLDMAISLAELGIDSIPINALMPIKGTPLENVPQLKEDEILRTIAFFRYINPEANIRLAAGRALLTNDRISVRCICYDHRKYADDCRLRDDPERPGDVKRNEP